MRCTALVLFLAAVAAAGPMEIKGRVLDADGKPVALADVGSSWSFKKEVVPFRGVQTDRKGHFTLPVNYYNRDLAVMAFDKKRMRGAVIRITKENVGREQTMTLQKVVRVHGRFDCTDPGTRTSSISSLLITLFRWYSVAPASKFQTNAISFGNALTARRAVIAARSPTRHESHFSVQSIVRGGLTH